MIMPFGIRELEDGHPHDFDAFFQQVLRKEAAKDGLTAIRVDDLLEPGTITDQAMRHLYTSDIVIADVSAPNSNVYYELGVRQAVSPGLTILVAVEGTSLPFDISSQRVLFYKRDFLQDQGFAERYREALRRKYDSSTNPVRDTLRALGAISDPQVDQQDFEQELNSRITRAQRDEQLIAVWHWTRQYTNVPTSGLLRLAQRLAEVEDYSRAAEVLSGEGLPADDFEVRRQRGFYLRKAGRLEPGLNELLQALELNPYDPQTLGMIAGTYKRMQRHEEALQHYERALRIAPSSLYLRVATAGMIVLANPSDLPTARGMYTDLKHDIETSEAMVGDYWADLVFAECCFVLGDFKTARLRVDSAVLNGAPASDAQSTAEQVNMLGAAGVYPSEATSLAKYIMRLVRNGKKIAPEVQYTNPHLIFHISDLHFGKAHRFRDDEISQRLSLELVEEFERAIEQSKCSIGDVTVVVSGDLVDTGSRSEFNLAHEFLAEICQRLGLGREQIVLVPGNHDVDWAKAAIDLHERFDNYLSFLLEFYGEELFRTMFPLVTWDFSVKTDRPASSELVLVTQRGPITFVGLNSCVFEDHQHHYGYIGVRQLRAIGKLLSRRGQGGVRMAVMHHHLHPHPESLGMARSGDDVIADLSTVRDAGLVEERLIQLGFSVLFHGHKHRAQLRESLVRSRGPATTTSRPLIISGCGGTGVGQDELEHGQPNHFAVLRLLAPEREEGANFLRVEWRELALADGSEWTPLGPWTLRG